MPRWSPGRSSCRRAPCQSTRIANQPTASAGAHTVVAVAIGLVAGERAPRDICTPSGEHCGRLAGGTNGTSTYVARALALECCARTMPLRKEATVQLVAECHTSRIPSQKSSRSEGNGRCLSESNVLTR